MASTLTPGELFTLDSLVTPTARGIAGWLGVRDDSATGSSVRPESIHRFATDLLRPKVAIESTSVARLVGTGHQLESVELADGRRFRRG